MAVRLRIMGQPRRSAAHTLDEFETALQRDFGFSPAAAAQARAAVTLSEVVVGVDLTVSGNQVAQAKAMVGRLFDIHNPRIWEDHAEAVQREADIETMLAEWRARRG